MPGPSHFFFIPLVLMLGFAFGFVFGGRAARDAEAAKAHADEAKAARKAARQQQKNG